MKEIFFISLLSSLIFAWIGYLCARVDILKFDNKALKDLNFVQEELIKELRDYNITLRKRINNMNR